MRPALQRLLTRPSSLALLRALVGPPVADGACNKQWTMHIKSTFHFPCQSHATASLAPDAFMTDDVTDNSTTETEEHPSEWEDDLNLRPEQQIRGGEIIASGGMATMPIRKIEFTDLEGIQNTIRLPINVRDYRRDPRLRLRFLKLLQRRYGDDGVMMFWADLRQRGVDLIISGPVASKFWETLLDLGFKRSNLLQEICAYANTLYETKQKRWSKLYVYIMRHLLLHGRGSEAVSWHDLLIPLHPPETRDFVDLVGEVVDRGDLDALKRIYVRNTVREVYESIVPPLVEKEDFAEALDWHYLLLRNGDKPTFAKVVQPLIQHYAIYYPWKAKKLTKSLVDSGVIFDTETLSNLKTTEKLSEDVINNIYHKQLGVKPASYNDPLGARWFATKWVSLDVAIAAVHALGVEEIGPLSLHSIALRDPSCERVMGRISQLRELGISVGDSLFSRALESFAKEQNQEFLTGLLESDQHPDVLEDRKLQEQLMTEFAERGELSAFNRTRAILLLGSSAPEKDDLNMTIRTHATRGDRTVVLQKLEEMRLKGVPVMTQTTGHIVKHILRPRKKGHNPPVSSTYTERYSNDVDVVISTLRGFMNHNGFVPITTWREIVRRLGMEGRLDDLDRVCIWLAEWYNTQTPSRWQLLRLASHLMSEKGVHGAPAQISTRHQLHPLRIFFSDALTESIIHWGFLHEMIKPHGRQSDATTPATSLQFTRGFHLLHELEHRGVYINPDAVRRAVLVRLQILYGPGQSKENRNRRARAVNPFPLKDMVLRLEEAWGRPLFEQHVEQLEQDTLSGKNLFKGTLLDQEISGPERGLLWKKNSRPRL